ncbi:MAG: CDP-glycerol glycerophosphotransferase family protein [Alphaproteobacteria bacterium]|nr:CDP-glycerol glycerophosphotransferase family protein [Alphaproteobacteria bacterium]
MSKKPLNIIIFVSYVGGLENLYSIYKACLKDENCNTYIIVDNSVDYFMKRNLGNNIINNYFAQHKIPIIDFYDENTKKYLDIGILKPDVIFLQTPYHLPTDILEHPCVCNIPYAFFLTTSDSEVRFYSGEAFESAWRIFAPTEYHKKKYQEYGNPDSKVIVIGYPKFDRYHEEIDENKSKWKIDRKKNPHIQRLLWCSHWTFPKDNDDLNGKNKLGASTFLQNYLYFLELAKRNKNIEIIFRPHPFLLKTLLDENYLSAEKISHYLQEIALQENMSIDANVEYFDVFKTSDILVTDNGSFLGEYLPTKKPIIYTHNYKNDTYHLNSLGIELTKDYYIARNVTELDDLIETVLIKKNDYNQTKRIDAMNRLIPNINEKAGIAIKNYVLKAFERI